MGGTGFRHDCAAPPARVVHLGRVGTGAWRPNSRRPRSNWHNAGGPQSQRGGRHAVLPTLARRPGNPRGREGRQLARRADSLPASLAARGPSYPAWPVHRPAITGPRGLMHAAIKALLAVVLCWNTACLAAAADDPVSQDLNWKLTLGEYTYTGYAGTDANLRWRAHDTSAWVGVYTDRVFGTQARTGADTSINLTDYLQLQPSLQLATRGFAGGSLNLQVGGPWYAIAGLG